MSTGKMEIKLNTEGCADVYEAMKICIISMIYFSSDSIKGWAPSSLIMKNTVPHQKLSLKSCGISLRVLTKAACKNTFSVKRTHTHHPTSHSHETSG